MYYACFSYSVRFTHFVYPPLYEVNYNGKQVVTESQAGLQLDNRVWEMALGMRKLPQPACWMDNLEVDSVAYGSHDTTWTPLWGTQLGA